MRENVDGRGVWTMRSVHLESDRKFNHRMLVLSVLLFPQGLCGSDVIAVSLFFTWIPQPLRF